MSDVFVLCLVKRHYGGDKRPGRMYENSSQSLFSSCFWSSPDIVSLSASLQSTHLEKKPNQILPARTKAPRSSSLISWLPILWASSKLLPKEFHIVSVD